MAMLATGRIISFRCCNRFSVGWTYPMGSTQPSCTAKMREKMSASAKPGNDTSVKRVLDTMRSKRPPSLYADTRPSGIEKVRATIWA